MSMVMDMSTGEFIKDGFGAFADEVPNAGLAPAGPGLRLELQQVRQCQAATHEVAADAWSAAVYRNPR